MSVLFYTQLDPNLSGTISRHDLHHFLITLSNRLRPTFLQKNLLLMLSKQLFRKLDPHNKGLIQAEDLNEHLPKLLHIFAGAPPYHRSSLTLHATQQFRLLSSNKGSISCTDLALIIAQRLPKTLPQKSFVSRLCAHAIFSLLDLPYETPIHEEQWVQCAFSLYREYQR